MLPFSSPLQTSIKARAGKVLDPGNEGLKALQPHTLMAQCHWCSFPSRVLPSSIPFIPWKGFTGCTEPRETLPTSPPSDFPLKPPVPCKPCCSSSPLPPQLHPGNSFPLTLCQQKASPQQGWAAACAWGCVFHWSLAQISRSCSTKPGKYLFCQAFQLGLI